jgi:serine/threonine protein kinase
MAIRILPKEMSADPARKQRLEWEAKTISSLNHPNICTLYDIGSVSLYRKSLFPGGLSLPHYRLTS